MRFFSRKPLPKLTAIKLYCIGEPENRELLLSRILSSLQEVFGALPEEFDIHGPYGIRKGSSIGYRAFQNKLTQKGHEKYYALAGETNGQFGFNLLLGARIGEITYTELVLWYASETYLVDFLQLVEPILGPLNASCGFDIDVPDGYSISTETKIKRSIFGSISIKVDHKHLAWLPSVREGAIRRLFRNNIVNSEQLSALASQRIGPTKPLSNGLHYISCPRE
jgi:hypothetical protein